MFYDLIYYGLHLQQVSLIPSSLRQRDIACTALCPVVLRTQVWAHHTEQGPFHGEHSSFNCFFIEIKEKLTSAALKYRSQPGQNNLLEESVKHPSCSQYFASSRANI